MKKLILSVLVVSTIFLSFSFIVSEPVTATNHGGNCSSSFLGIPPWHKYLDLNPSTCEINAPDGLLAGNIPWLIAAAVLEMLLRVATYAAVVMIFWGGYQLMTSSGSPDAVSGGRDKIVNGIIGFIIAMMAVALVSYITTSIVSDVRVDDFNLPDAGEGGTGVVEFILNIVYRLAAGVTAIMVAIAGFKFLTSGGEPQKVGQARNTIIYAVVGLVITLLAFIIIVAVGDRL